MAFMDRIKTKLVQAVTDAEKTQLDPTLKEGIRQFEEMKSMGDDMREAVQHALPSVGSSSKMTKVELLGNLVKQAAAKYGLDHPEALGLSYGGDAILAIGKVERELLRKAEHDVYTLHRSNHDYYETLKKEKSKLEDAMTDMDGAKIKAKSGKEKDAPAKVVSTTRAYEKQKAAVEKMVATLPEHRDKQRQAVKILLEALREFYAHAGEVVEQHLASI